MNQPIRSALLSVFHKEGLDAIAVSLHKLNVTIYATGGTFDFIQAMGIPVIPVENITGFPSILDGRVKTLHPAVFGGILSVRNDQAHQAQMLEYKLPLIDLVVVDLYPFEKTVASGAMDAAIIEKIDIGGISLIRAAAKNFNDVVIIPSVNYYRDLQIILDHQNGETSLDQRKALAKGAFGVSSHYDTAINNWFSGINVAESESPIQNLGAKKQLRYGENPHQKAAFHGDLDAVFNQLNGKELSYNNLLDIDAAVALINEFEDPTVAVVKHNNACGLATDTSLLLAWRKALAGDPVSAFGGVISSNRKITKDVAEEMNSLFFEVLIAPGFDADALEILMTKKNRMLLESKPFAKPTILYRSVLNGILEQEPDNSTESVADLKTVTTKTPSETELSDLVFANKIVKYSKSNAIVLTKNGQLCASGVGQTSRVDALKQAIAKAQHFGFDLRGAVMSSDAFFPFSDCIEIAAEAGITAVVQPGGSIRDQDSIDACNKLNVSMAITNIRHFKH